jgi:hypothetical protein
VLSAQKHVHDTVNSVFAIIGCDCSFHIKSWNAREQTGSNVTVVVFRT